MRRPLVILLSMFMLSALVPSAALARPTFSVTTITVKGVGTGSATGTCMLRADVSWAAANQVKAVQIVEDWGSGTDDFVVTVPRATTAAGGYFYGVDLDAFAFRWGAQLLGGGGKVLAAAWSQYESWTADGCPTGTQTIAFYPTT